MKSLYALLVGINDYQSPFEKLQGCKKDVKKISDYIHSSLGDQFSLNVKTLLDKQATYDNVITTFESHLGKADPEDVVWFHFSGHGSEELSAPEFHVTDTTKKDQTMLCYDSLPNKAYNLADKELAALIHMVATSFPNGEKKDKSPHILISLDCCHSGSGTRSANTAQFSGIRSAQSFPRKRPLSSNAKGFYNAKAISIPMTPHINISACRRNEVAGDTNTGGAFTSGFVKALKESKSDITYADLYLRTRAAVKKIRSLQNPKFSFLAEMSPYLHFLSKIESNQSAEYPVYFSSAKWRIKYGAIHGLVKKPNEKIEIDILKTNRAKTKVGSAEVLEIGAQESLLEINMAFEIRSWFSSTTLYIGAIKSLQVEKEHVTISGNEAEVTQFLNNWSSIENIELTESNDLKTNLSLEINDTFCLYDENRKEQIFVTSNQEEIGTAIHQATQWYRFLDLHNPDPLSNISDGFTIELVFQNATKTSVEYHGNAQVIQVSSKNEKNEKLGIQPKVYIKNGRRDYFFYLFYMDEDYSVTCPEEETLFRGDFDGDGVTDMDEKSGNHATDHRAANSFNEAERISTPDDFKHEKGIEQALWKDVKGIALSEGKSSSTTYLKLIVTSQELDYFQFIQGGLGIHRSDSTKPASTFMADDWSTLMIELNVNKE